MASEDRCRIVASKGPADIQVVVIGHAAVELSAELEQEAVRLAKGEAGSERVYLGEDGPVMLCQLKEEAWYAAGEAWRVLGGRIVAQLREAGYASAAVDIEAADDAVQALVEGILLGDYRYTAFRSGKAAKRKAITLRFPGHKVPVQAGVQVAQAQNLARSFADAPGNDMHPQSFVKRARKIFAGTDCVVDVISGVSALRKAGFPGLAQVGMAGHHAPAMLQIAWRPGGKSGKGKSSKAKSKGPRLALVGKGVTFDTGGISLKPGADMWEMKGDMGGAAAVLGAMQLIAVQKPKVPVTGYIALAENMPDTDAQRPGDIYEARNGKFIHVDNTDAEGRLVMSDVLTYACEQGATHMVNLATLTGAIRIALGLSIGAVMSRPQHSDWADTLKQVGAGTGEDWWQMPLFGEYRKQLDHPHADLNNIGGRLGGSLTAGLFLAEFVDPEVQWAHCDIAGPAMRTDGWRYFAKGNTGFGVRTCAALAAHLAD